MVGHTRAEQELHHTRRDPHVRGRWLSDLVLGAQDGIVNTLGVVLGVAAATIDTRVILATGMAAAAAESISMAAVAYTSSRARGDLYRAEREREYRHLDVTPDIERDEVRTLFEAKGFEGELLNRAVDTVCSNRETWVSMMMSEEHGLTAIDQRMSMISSAIVGCASLIPSIAIVLPFLVPHTKLAIPMSFFIGVLSLLALGALKAKLTTGSHTRSALTLATIGILSALAGFGVGSLFSAL